MKTREQFYDELFDGAFISNSPARVNHRLRIIDEIAAQSVKERDAEIERLRNVLEFYADPTSYYAVLVMGDPMCGEFAHDVDFNEEFGRDIPGKAARAALATDGRKP